MNDALRFCPQCRVLVGIFKRVFKKLKTRRGGINSCGASAKTRKNDYKGKK